MTVLWKFHNEDWINQFADQSFFDNFNWFNFVKGDVIYLEDYEGDDFRRLEYAGIYVGLNKQLDPIVTLLPNIAILALQRGGDIRNVSEMTSGKKYWQKFLC